MSRSGIAFIIILGWIGGLMSKDVELDSDVIDIAKSYIGTPYKYGGTSRKGMDCSGLTTTVFKSQGIRLPRSASQQSKVGKKIKLKDVALGDLIFFKKGGRIFHVGVISKVGRNKLWMIHSTKSNGVAEMEILNSAYWKPKLHQIKRVL